jgi:hypothetical protein
VRCMVLPVSHNISVTRGQREYAHAMILSLWTLWTGRRKFTPSSLLGLSRGPAAIDRTRFSVTISSKFTIRRSLCTYISLNEFERLADFLYLQKLLDFIEFFDLLEHISKVFAELIKLLAQVSHLLSQGTSVQRAR